MSRDRQVNIQQQFKFLGPLNHEKTIHLIENQDKKFIAKRIYVHQNKINEQMNVMTNLNINDYSVLVKPELFDIQPECLWLISPVMPLSL